LLKGRTLKVQKAFYKRRFRAPARFFDIMFIFNFFAKELLLILIIRQMYYWVDQSHFRI